MARFLRWLFGGHDHRWKLIDQIDIYAANEDELPYSRKYVLQCEHCGCVRSYTA